MRCRMILDLFNLNTLSTSVEGKILDPQVEFSLTLTYTPHDCGNWITKRKPSVHLP